MMLHLGLGAQTHGASDFILCPMQLSMYCIGQKITDHLLLVVCSRCS